MLLDIQKLTGQIRGVLHIGAFIGEELELYQKMHISNIIFFEPMQYTYQMLKDKVQNFATTYNFALGNYNGKGNMYASKFDHTVNYITGASSSLLKPKKHLDIHPAVIFPEMEEVEVRRLDDVIAEEQIDVTNYNFMNIDVQGYELEVLKGSAHTLDSIDYIVSEVNNDEVYEQCALINEIDEFLSTYSFVREETNWAGGMWGDALYIKKKV